MFKKSSIFQGHKDKITSIVSGADGTLVSGSEDKTVRVWDTRAPRAVSAIIGFPDEITAVGLYENISIACNNTIASYDRRALSTITHAGDATKALQRAQTRGDVEGTSTCGDFTGFVTEHGEVGIFDTADGTLTQFAGAHEFSTSVALNSADLELATGGFSSQIAVWSIADERIERTVGTSARGGLSRKAINPPFVYALEYLRDPGALVSAHADGRIMVAGDAGCYCWVDCHGYSISAIEMAAFDPETVVSAGLDRKIKLWDRDELSRPNVSPEPPAGSESGAATVVLNGAGDGPPVKGELDLERKPDTLATAATAPIIFTDSGSEIVGYTVCA